MSKRRTFFSYQQLLETVEVPQGRPVLFRDFAEFFTRHRQKVGFADAHQCFEELRGVLTAEPEGPLSLEAYLALGVRQSIFSPEQRTAVYPVFLAWRAWLSEKGLYEPNLVAHGCLARLEPRYDFVAIDEVQDLTNAQLAPGAARPQARRAVPRRRRREPDRPPELLLVGEGEEPLLEGGGLRRGPARHAAVDELPQQPRRHRRRQ